MREGGYTLGGKLYANFNLFYELMARKVREILLVSSPYDAFIIEEDGTLASRIINEYSGLNLSQPPRVTRTSSAYEALAFLDEKEFDMVLTMPHLSEMDPFSFGMAVKNKKPGLPVHLLAHTSRGIYPLADNVTAEGIDKIFIWSGNSDLLLALIKNAEDLLNVDADTRTAMVRVLILVEDSPVYYSSFLPFIYKEIVRQTQAVLEAGLNEEHRLLTMRARPKILLARSYNEALGLYRKYRSYLLGIISDTRLPMDGVPEGEAGVQLLSHIRRENPYLPLLLLSSDPGNGKKAEDIPAVFLDKNSQDLFTDINAFFLNHLGFGDFIFRSPDGHEIDRASNLHELEQKLMIIPDDVLLYHAKQNHFSNWIMARSEIVLASMFREVVTDNFTTADKIREYLISNINTSRKWRQKGVVAQFKGDDFDAEIMDFVKIGKGSLGGKARGLAFMTELLHQHRVLRGKYPGINIEIPKTLVICTDGFESFVSENNLRRFAGDGFTDQEIADAFLKADMPAWIAKDLEMYLTQVTYSLSVRSSSLLEDAQFQPYAGLYQTYMVSNNHSEQSMRFRQVIDAVKLVFASTYYEGPKAFARNTSNKAQEEAMAVIIQELVGRRYGDYFYPAISGVAQSHNYYPVSRMKAEEGIAHIALGFGKTVVDGERALRFSPRYPTLIPQFSAIDDILTNSQRFFYALKMDECVADGSLFAHSNLERREIYAAADELPVKALASTFIPVEGRIRDTGHIAGPKVITFAEILKHDTFPLPEILSDLIAMGRDSMGSPVEIEFAVNLNSEDIRKSDFYFLQIRPMVADEDRFKVTITNEDIDHAVCFSTQALGNGISEAIADIMYVKPDDFDPAATLKIVEEIGTLNAALHAQQRSYLLIGPGRWGSSDRWLGIPVQWQHISGVGAIIELRNSQLSADPSQGSHFFQNITSLGIHYITVTEGTDHFVNWDWLHALPAVRETAYLRHVRLKRPVTIKIDGRKSMGVVTPA